MIVAVVFGMLIVLWIEIGINPQHLLCQPLLDLPFSEPHSVQILQDDGAENTVAITGNAVYMDHADCENQDCVQMGEVTRDNLELRVMGGFIICLPHKISVEVRDG